MKLKSLLIAIFATATLVAQAQITGVSLTITDTKSNVIPIPSTMSTVDLSEGGSATESNLVLNTITVTTSSAATSAYAYGRVYKVGSTAPAFNSIPLTSGDGLTWTISPNIDLLDNLTAGALYAFDFYAEAVIGGNTYYYNNGGSFYEVTYIPDAASNDITFYSTEPTAAVVFESNNGSTQFELTGGSGSRSPSSGQLGTVSSLKIKNWAIRCQRQAGVNLGEVCMYWRIREETSEKPTVKNYTTSYFNSEIDESGDILKKLFSGTNVNEDLIGTWCESGKDYRVEIYYRLLNTGNSKKYYFGKDDDVEKQIFQFFFKYVDSGTPVEEAEASPVVKVDYIGLDGNKTPTANKYVPVLKVSTKADGTQTTEKVILTDK